MHKIYILLFITYLFSAANAAFAQKPISLKYNIKRYTDENGLPQNSIKGISADSDGYIWLATEDGLTRFDGRQFYVFNKANIGISTNRVYLFQPSMNISPGTGLNRQEAGKKIYALVDGNEFVRISNGTAVRDSNYYADEVKPFLFLQKRKDETYFSSKLPDYMINNTGSRPIMISVGHGNGNFYVCDTTSIQYFSHGKKIYETPYQNKKKKNFFLIADKLYHFNENGTITYINQKNNINFSLSGDITNHPSYKPDGKDIQVFWNNASDQVYLYLDKNLYSLAPLDNGKADTKILIEDFDFPTRNIESIHINKDGQTIFLGSLTQGLFVLAKHPFQTLQTPGDDMENVFYAQIPYDQNTILTPTGIVIGKELNSIKTIFKQLPGFDKFNQRDKRSLLRDNNGFIWIKAGWELMQMDGKAEKVIHQWVMNEEIKHIYQGKTGTIWMGMASTGLYQIDPADPNGLPKQILKDLKVTYLEAQTPDRLLVGTTDGLYSVDIISGKTHLIDETKGLYIKSINTKHTDEIWFTALENGLLLYTKEKLINFPLDEKRYLASAHCVVDDENGFFWIPTNKGLFQIAYQDLVQYARNEENSVKHKSPNIYNTLLASQLFYNYYSRDQGFNTNEFNGNCQPCDVKLPNGYISLPSLNGLVWFSAGEVNPIKPNGKIILDKVEINLKPLTSHSDTIRIPLNSAQIKFYFSTPYYGNPYSLHLSYALVAKNEHVDKVNWLPFNSNDFSLTFTNLNSGNYTLLVKKMNGFGYNNFTITKLTLIIPPPWFQTWWAISIFALILIAAVYTYNKIRLYRIKKQNRRLELKIIKRTRKLNRTLTDLETSKSEVSRQLHMMSRLLTSMTHDIQTPLNYIALTAGSIPQLIVGKDYADIGEIGRLIANSSQGMSSLLKDLLDYIKVNVYSKSLKFDDINVSELIEKKIQIFTSVNELKHNKVFNHVPESLIVRSDYQMLAIIIHNLIDNATKFTDKGIFIISSERIDGKVHLIFSNNGTPISNELLNMFNEDSAFTDTSSTIGRKTGLGFLIVKEIASLIKVRLKVNQTETTNFHLIFEGPL